MNALAYFAAASEIKKRGIMTLAPGFLGSNVYKFEVKERSAPDGRLGYFFFFFFVTDAPDKKARVFPPRQVFFCPRVGLHLVRLKRSVA